MWNRLGQAFFIGKELTIPRIGLRVNDQIRISPVRLINEEDIQVGIIETAQALSMANEAGLDLVEVSPNEQPPVCRIMDYGKWKYRRSKKVGKTKTHQPVLKEIRLRPKIGQHDQDVNVKHAREFITKGDKVLFSMRFRGREMAHYDLGIEMFQQIKAQLEDVAKVESDYTMSGRRLSMVLAPLK